MIPSFVAPHDLQLPRSTDRRSVAGRVRALALTGLVALGGILRVRGPATGLVVAGRVALGGF
jgi:hypothetical protein